NAGVVRAKHCAFKVASAASRIETTRSAVLTTVFDRRQETNTASVGSLPQLRQQNLPFQNFARADVRPKGTVCIRARDNRPQAYLPRVGHFANYQRGM